jgi:segregation and condensation protein B
MARRARQTESLDFDPELAELPAEARWREWMNRIEAVLFAAPQPVERAALARIVGRDASIDLLIEDIMADLRGKPYDVTSSALPAVGSCERGKPMRSSSRRPLHCRSDGWS